MSTSRVLQAMREISKAREKGELSDLTFVCDDEKIPVHKIVVCTQSPVFRKAFTGPFKEQETGIYEIKDSSIGTVRQMVEYLYTGEYSPVPDNPDAPCNTVSTMVFHARMSVLADKYLIDGLQTLSVIKFKKAAEEEMDVCKFLQSIPDIYSLPRASSDKLRDYIIKAFRKNRMKLSSPNAGVDKAFDEVTHAVPQFAEELLTSFLHHPFLGYCDNCSQLNPLSISEKQTFKVLKLTRRCMSCGSEKARLLK